ncbi:MAG TPA: DUF1365 domain-containing protein [Pseudonocardia sp.]|nr:DUF1365 domain-containing protein [Pseudonocardia sp.]
MTATRGACGRSAVLPAQAPALYDVEVRHVRHAALHRDFRHRVYLWLVDLEALPRLPRWLRPFAGFRAADHLGDPGGTLRGNLDRYLAGRGIDLRGGRVLMLANARVLGHVFNPLTVYWCHRPDGSRACVVAEVHNTYGERHCYLLATDDAGRARAAKDFYVSPFLAVDGEYRMHLPVPDERLSLAITLRQNGSMALVATVAGERRSAAPGSLVRMVARRPLVTLRTSALIRRHGVALWLRRLPVIPRPRHAPQEGVQ